MESPEAAGNPVLADRLRIPAGLTEHIAGRLGVDVRVVELTLHEVLPEVVEVRLRVRGHKVLDDTSLIWNLPPADRAAGPVPLRFQCVPEVRGERRINMRAAQSHRAAFFEVVDELVEEVRELWPGSVEALPDSRPGSVEALPDSRPGPANPEAAETAL